MSQTDLNVPQGHAHRPRSAQFLRVRHLALAAALAGVLTPQVAHAQSDPYIGQLALFGNSFCPRGWTEAQGQLQSIAQNTALFSLLGTTYGGDGRTTFALPDLRGRVPVGLGQGPGLESVVQGEQGGSESKTLSPSNLPAHTHPLYVSSEAATNAAPDSSRMLAVTQNAGSYRAASRNENKTALDLGSVGLVGSNVPIDVRNPYLGMRWCIAMEGIFPSRQ